MVVSDGRSGDGDSRNEHKLKTQKREKHIKKRREERERERDKREQRRGDETRREKNRRLHNLIDYICSSLGSRSR